MKYLIAVVLVFASCGQQTETLRKESRTLRRETIEKRQEITPNGQLIQLTTRTVTIENEATGEKISETVEVEAPKFLGSLADVGKALVVGAGAAVGGPAGGAAADMLWQTLAGVGGAGAAAATGKMAIEGRRRKKLEEEIEEIADRADTLERQRNELIDGVESAKDHMDDATWGKVAKTLEDNQHDDTIAEVRKRTA
jgi:cell division protein FtsB